MQILVVEDVAFIRKLTESQLQARGHQVIAVSSGYEALDVLTAEKSIDLVISDLFLADINGFQLFEECEKLPRFKKHNSIPPPFVLMTSSDNPQDLRKAEAMGFMAALTKPLDMARIEEIIVAIGEGNAFLNASRAKGKILLVDSVGKVSDMMQDIMRGSGYTVLQASTGEECISYLAEYRNIQLIVSDLELQDTNAIKLLKHCQDEQMKNLANGLAKSMPPFVLMTESQNSDLVQVAYLASFTDIILAPLDKNIIKQKLNRLFIAEGNNSEPQKSILIVDDVHFHCILTLLILKQNQLIGKENYNFLIAESGEEALKYLKSDKSIRLVLSDYAMPDMNGLEVYSETKKIYQKSQQVSGKQDEIPPFIMLTVCENKTHLETALSDGFKAVINKPLDSKQLNQLVTQFLAPVDQQIDVP